jgi:hypothetical protein
LLTNHAKYDKQIYIDNTEFTDKINFKLQNFMNKIEIDM